METPGENVVLGIPIPLQPKDETYDDDLISELNLDDAQDSSSQSTSWGASPETDDASLFSQDDLSTPDTSRSESSDNNDSSNTGWDDHVAELPEDRPLSPPVPPKPVVYFKTTSFKTRHYFFRWLQTTLEAACFDFGMKYLRRELDLLDGKNCNPCLHTQLQRWTQPGRIELDMWADFYDDYTLACPFPKRDQEMICRGAALLRHKTIHREDLSIKTLEYAMMLPEMLGDAVLGAKVKWVYEAVCRYDNLEEAVKQEVDGLLYPEEKPPIHPYQLIQRIQDILEPVFFNYIRLTTPEFLDKHGVVEAEQVELQAYQDLGYNQVEQQALWDARRIRVDATHRKAINSIQYRVEQGKELAIIFGDSAQADRIQHLADDFLLSWDPKTSDGSEWLPVVQSVGRWTRIAGWFKSASRKNLRALKRIVTGSKLF
jgi:hypothetical protein